MKEEVALPNSYKQFLNAFGDNWETFYEVGVHLYYRCRLKEMIDYGKNVVLFEPKPEAAEDIRKNIEGKDNVTLHEVALADFNGTQNLYVDDRASAYLESVKEQNDRTIDHSDKLKVEVRKISEFDKGDVDVLLIDAEGSEHLILKELVSRPAMIVVEVTKTGYTKANGVEIYGWMGSNGYRFVERHEDDAIFWKQNYH